MSFETLLVERDGAIAVVTINRPKVLNALNSQTISELGRAMHELQQDDGVRAIILTGAGERAYDRAGGLLLRTTWSARSRRRNEWETQFKHACSPRGARGSRRTDARVTAIRKPNDEYRARARRALDGDRSVVGQDDVAHHHQGNACRATGRWIALETWVDNPDGGSTNQLGIAPADGSAPPRLIGPQLRNQAIVKSWAPDSSTLLFAARDEKLVFQADPETGETERLPWNSELPDWQRRAP